MAHDPFRGRGPAKSTQHHAVSALGSQEQHADLGVATLCPSRICGRSGRTATPVSLNEPSNFLQIRRARRASVYEKEKTNEFSSSPLQMVDRPISLLSRTSFPDRTSERRSTGTYSGAVPCLTSAGPTCVASNRAYKQQIMGGGGAPDTKSPFVARLLDDRFACLFVISLPRSHFVSILHRNPPIGAHRV